MRPDDETSAEMEALRRQRLWYAYTRSDRRGPRSPLRRGLIASAVVAVLALLGAFVSGMLVAAGDDDAAPTTTVAATTTTVPPTTTAAPMTTTTTATTTPTTTVPPPTTMPPPVTVSARVEGTQPWTDTGLDVAAGTVVDVTATGRVAHDLWDAGTWVGPDGDPRPEKSIFNLVIDGVRLDGNHVGLIGRVGGGAPFLVGAAAHLTMPAGGRLFLGVNDNGLDNNDGAFDVVVTVAG